MLKFFPHLRGAARCATICCFSFGSANAHAGLSGEGQAEHAVVQIDLLGTGGDNNGIDISNVTIDFTTSAVLSQAQAVLLLSGLFSFARLDSPSQRVNEAAKASSKLKENCRGLLLSRAVFFRNQFCTRVNAICFQVCENRCPVC